MKKGSFILALLFFTKILLSQEQSLPKKFYSYGFQFGTLGWSSSYIEPRQGSVPMNRTINPGIARLDQKRNGRSTTLSMNSSLGIHFSFCRQTNTRDLVSVGAGLFLNRSAYSFTLPYTIMQNNVQLKHWRENNMYLAFLPSIRYSWLNGSGSERKYPGYTYFGLAAGISLLHSNYLETVNKGHKEEYMVNGSGIKTEYLAARNTGLMLGAEVGQRFVLKKRNRSLEIGLIYFWSPQNTYVKQMDYYSQGILLGGARVDLKGSMIVLNCRYSLNRLSRKQMADTAHKEPELPKYQLMSLNGRGVDVQEAIVVNKARLDVYLWDDAELDGDVISVYLNTDLVLKDYQLTRTKTKITVDLIPGANYLSIHAEDVGSSPPVITAVRIFKNEIPKNRTLTSDFQTSGSWKIIYKPTKP